MSKRLTVRISLLLGGLVLMIIGLMNCTAISTTAPHAEDLLIDLSMLPPEWSIKGSFSVRDDLHVLRDQDAVDFAGIEFAPPGAEFGSRLTAGHTVWNFGNSLYATWKFSGRFRPPESILSGEKLHGWSYHSKVADRFRLYCRVVEPIPEAHIYEGGWTECTAVGQYHEFISVFVTPIGAEYSMTLEELERILKAIDERMAQLLKGDTR